MDYLHYSIL